MKANQRVPLCPATKALLCYGRPWRGNGGGVEWCHETQNATSPDVHYELWEGVWALV